MPGRTVTVTSLTKPETYTISYENIDEASVSNPTSYTIETPDFSLNNPEKTGYSFV